MNNVKVDTQAQATLIAFNSAAKFDGDRLVSTLSGLVEAALVRDAAEESDAAD